MQILDNILAFIKDYSNGFKVWMKFLVLKTVILVATCYFLQIDVNKVLSVALEKPVTEMYIEPEKAAGVGKILNYTVDNVNADGAYIFAYLPMYAIKSSSLLQSYENKGINFLSFENYTNVPVTIDGMWFLRMQANQLYYREVTADGIYSKMYERGVRHFYAYPIIGHDDVLYGNLMVAYKDKPKMEEEHIREYLRITADQIIQIVGK